MAANTSLPQIDAGPCAEGLALVDSLPEDAVVSDHQARLLLRLGDASLAGVHDLARILMVSRWHLGRYFLAQKERVGHGNWQVWAEGNWPELSIDTIQRLMRLAKTATLRFLVEGDRNTVRQGYIALVVPEKEHARADAPVRGAGLGPVGSLLSLVNKAEKWWHKNVRDRGGVRLLPASERAELRANTRGLYQELKELHGEG